MQSRPVTTAVVIVLCFYYSKAENHPNNVCPTFEDYHTIENNKRCWYNFAADSTAPEIIEKSGYEVEEHKATTEDGYILTLFRIPKQGGQPVFLIHGVLCTSTNFVSLGKDSLAFQLADAGYDVWLGSYRGNEYSEGHVNLTVNDKKYWEHSIDELAHYDIPAMLHLVSHETGNKSNIIYIGHSLGTALGLIYASEFPDEAESLVKLFVLLSPSYKLGNMISPYRHFRTMFPSVREMLRKFNAERLVQQAGPSRQIVKQICMESPELMRLCIQTINMFFGKDTQMGPEIVPVLFNQLPGGTALRVIYHIGQQINNKFAHYDYGMDNLRIYGQLEPPDYNIKRIKVPCYIVYSLGDWATTKKDALILYDSLPKEAQYGVYEVKDKNFNHMDFLFGRHAKRVLYDHLLNVIKSVAD